MFSLNFFLLIFLRVHDLDKIEKGTWPKHYFSSYRKKDCLSFALRGLGKEVLSVL